MKGNKAIAIRRLTPVWTIAICLVVPAGNPLDTKAPANQIVPVVPMFAPNIAAIAEGSGSAPLATKATIVVVERELDCHNKVINKVNEELNELKLEINKETKNNNIVEEYGDLLFTITQLGRHLNIDPETSLYKANTKFRKRFIHLLNEFKNKRDFKKSSSRIKEKTWKIIKKLDWNKLIIKSKLL